MNFAFKTRNFALTTRNCVFKTRNCAFKTMNFADGGNRKVGGRISNCNIYATLFWKNFDRKCRDNGEVAVKSGDFSLINADFVLENGDYFEI